MRINYELIREMLLVIESYVDGENFIDGKSFVLHCEHDDYSDEQMVYHMKYLIDAGYLETSRMDRWYFRDISPMGREYLENIRDDKIWRIVKDKLSALSSASPQVLVRIATQVAINYLTSQ